LEKRQDGFILGLLGIPLSLAIPTILPIRSRRRSDRLRPHNRDAEKLAGRGDVGLLGLRPHLEGGAVAANIRLQT